MKQHRGQSIIELIVAIGIFALLASSLVLAYLDAHITGQQGAEEAQATFLVREGLEAVRAIRNNQWNNLTNGSHGLTKANGYWEFSGVSETNLLGRFTRTIVVGYASRDANGNLVTAGSPDAKTKIATSTVTWTTIGGRPRTISLVTYMARWRGPSNGMLVFSGGGTTLDTVNYKLFDGATGTWGATSTVADVDTGSTNRALRRAELFASPTRDEKILLSRHYNGTTQYIYAQVYDGAAASWSDVQLLASWNAATFTDVRNFDGAYTSAGNFFAVFSDNTTVPKTRTWDGSAWSSQASLPDIGGIPTYIVTRTRPGTNEIMAALFDQQSDTNTEYYSGSVWSAATEHATLAPLTTKKYVDFVWNTNTPTKGALVFSDSGTDTTIATKVFTADGVGGGAWGAAVQSTARGTLGAMDLVARPGANEFDVCDQDAARDIYCHRIDTTPTWTNPTNPSLTLTSDTGIQRAFEIGFYATTGTTAIAVYSDATAIPKLKKYTASTNTWDVAATNISSIATALETVRVSPDPFTNDNMILMANTGQRLFTQMWNATTTALYTNPSGKAFYVQGLAGSADEDYWYDFVWDAN